MTDQKSRSPLEWTLITLILLVAALFRFHDLGNIPRGLEHDEVATWYMVTTVLEGEHPIYFEEGYGHEPLFNYLTAFSVSLFGHNWLGERFWAPWFGMFAVAATYALLRRMFDSVVGLSAAGFQATVLWALFFNRLGLRLNQLPFLLCVVAYCFWRGLQVAGSEKSRTANSYTRLRYAICDLRIGWFVAAGTLMGLCFYTYPSSRVVLPVFGAFTAYLIAHDVWIEKPKSDTKMDWRQLWSKWWPILVCFVVAALVMMPLALYLSTHTSATTIPQRAGQVNRPLEELRKGNPGPILENVWGLLKMWNVDGERYWQLNYSHRPVFVEPISGVLFWIGVFLVLWRWKEPRTALLAIWIGLGMVPSLLTSEAPSWPRTMLASPAALALPGIAVFALLQWSRDCKIRLFVDLHLYRFAQVALLALLTLSLLLTTVLTYRDFLVIWPQHPRVRYAFQSSLTEALRYLDATMDVAPVVMAGLSPHDVDPWTEKATLRRDDLSIRWIDARSAMVLPSGNVARLIVLDITPLEPTLSNWAGLAPDATIAQGQTVPRGGTEYDVDAPVYYGPAYTAYRLDVAALRQRVRSAQAAAYVGSDPFAPTLLDESPRLGDLVRLAGYEWLTLPKPNAPAQLLTFWEVLDTGPGSTVYGEPALRIFVHLLDGDRSVAAGVDVLGAAPDTWREGDVIVQLHAFTFPGDPGEYAVELGWYVPPNGPRLPVDGIEAPGQRILLSPVEVGE